MGKKVRKKGRTPVKEKTVAKHSSKAPKEEVKESMESVENGVSTVKEKIRCQHLDKEADLSKLSDKINGTDEVRCEDCRESCGDRRGNKGKGKQGKKKVGNGKSDLKAVWVCLACGHYACGGVGLLTNPQSHAVRHARQTRHPMVIQFENPGLRWCFPCNMLIPVEKTEDSGQKDVFADVVKLIKGRSSKGASTDVEEIWFEAGSVSSQIKLDGASSSALDGKAGYTVRGLSNLGNTCFFNSVTQNLLSITRLRDYFLKLDESIGPLTISLKKLYGESNPDAGMKGVINPRSFFGTVCTKAPQFKGYQQHDSHELLRCLLDSLCTEELAARKRSNSFQGVDRPDPGPTFIDAVFGGEISSTVSCVECGHSSTVCEPFLDLSLPVPKKKPPSKRSQLPSRSKKAKVPPKKSGKTRPKVDKNSDLVAPQNASDMSNTHETSDQANLIVPDSKEILAASSDSTMLARMASTSNCTDKELSQNLSAVQSHEQQGIEKSTQHMIPSCDDSTWLDFLDPAPVPEEHNWTSQDDQISVSQNFAYAQSDNEQSYGESTNFSTALCDDFAWLDYMEPCIVPDNEDATPQDIQLSASKDFGNKNKIHDDELVESGCSSGSHIHLQNKELNQKTNSYADHREDELPLQVNDSEVLLLPYTGEASHIGKIMTGEEVGVPSSSVGCEQDNAEFDGFGDLFNEPEVAGPPAKSLLSNGNLQTNDVSESSIVARNSSESDPDEVDDANAPVSVESCLAYFIKPELLCDDNAWHCENCSRILWQQQLIAKKISRNASKSLINECEASAQHDMPNFDSDVAHPKGVKLTSNKNVRCDDSLASNSRIADNLNGHCMKVSAEDHELKSDECQEEEIDMNGVQETTSSSSCYKTCDEESPSDQANGSSDVQESSSNMHDTNKVRLIGSQLPGCCDSEEGENDKLEVGGVKVKRNATKRVLINRAPPILTVHLKRFSQDARGRLNKLNGHIDFREIIDLRPYMDSRTAGSENYIYRLVGVVEHMGTMRGGHYVAYVRGDKRKSKSEEEIGDSVWYYASDAHVHEVSKEEVFRCDAYILFYEKI